MFYQRLRDLREDTDLTQKDISDMLKIGLSTYQRYERGELKIYLESAHILANFYKVSLDYIAGRTNDKRGLKKSDLPDTETQLLKKFRSLSSERKGKILERLDILTEEQEEENEKNKGVV